MFRIDNFLLFIALPVVVRDVVPCRCGWATPLNCDAPPHMAFGPWLELGRDLARARSLRAKCGAPSMPPRWQAEGSGQTARDMRRRRLALPISAK